MLVNVAVFVSGDGSNFEAIVTQAKTLRVALLITDQEDAYARKRAERLGIQHKVIRPKDYKGKALYEAEILNELVKHNVAFIVLAGYMRKVGSTLLNAYPNRILNIHPSLLPSYKGLDALKRSYDALSPYLGVTIHVVDAHLDHGKILKQAKFKRLPLQPFDVCKQEIHRLEHKHYCQTIENYILEVNR